MADGKDLWKEKGVRAKKTFADMQQELTDKWGADGTDFRLFENLAKYLSGNKGSDMVQKFPASVRDIPEYKGIIQKATYEDGRKAKTLLAIMSEFGEIEGLTSSQETGSLSEGTDLGLVTMIEYVVPILVQDLSVYTGYKGYHLPENIARIKNPERRMGEIMTYTKNWVVEKMGDDPQVSHLVENQEDAFILDMFASNEALRVAEVKGKLERGEILNEDDLDLLNIAAMTDETVRKMMAEKGIGK